MTGVRRTTAPAPRSARTTTAPKAARVKPKTVTVKPTKRADCDADDLAEGDVRDCGAAALVVPAAAAATTVTAAGASATAPMASSAQLATPARPGILRWILIIGGTLLLLLLLILIARRLF